MLGFVRPSFLKGLIPEVKIAASKEPPKNVLLNRSGRVFRLSDAEVK